MSDENLSGGASAPASPAASAAPAPSATPAAPASTPAPSASAAPAPEPAAPPPEAAPAATEAPAVAPAAAQPAAHEPPPTILDEVRSATPLDSPEASAAAAPFALSPFNMPEGFTAPESHLGEWGTLLNDFAAGNRDNASVQQLGQRAVELLAKQAVERQRTTRQQQVEAFTRTNTQSAILS